MVSNKTLALFIIAAVVVSLGGTILSLNKLQEISQLKRIIAPTKQVTGMASGYVNLTISTNTSCNIDTNVSFGSSGKPGAEVILSTNQTNTGTFNDCLTNAACQGMQINNTGNTNINVTLMTDYNASTMLGGSGASQDDFQAKAINGTAANGGAVHPGCGGLNNTWFYVNESVRPIPICYNLTWEDTNDMLTIEYNVTIDANTPPGPKAATITVTCTQTA